VTRFALAALAAAAPALGQFAPTSQDRRVFAHAERYFLWPSPAPPPIIQTEEIAAHGIGPFTQLIDLPMGGPGSRVGARPSRIPRSVVAPDTPLRRA
jgi:hypothetical protein